MATCPKLQKSNVPDNIITIDNINDVRISTKEVTIGTQVTISCNEGRTVIGPSKVTCIKDGTSAKWNPSTPTCALKTVPTPTASNLTQQEIIVIGVVGAICGLVLIMILVILISYWYKRKRDRVFHKRPSSEYSYTTRDMDRALPYSAYAPFPGGSVDHTNRYYTSLPRSTMPSSFPISQHSNAYEMATRSGVIRPRPYMNYAVPRGAGSDVYDAYVTERNSRSYRPYVVEESSRAYSNDAFRGEWPNRFERKQFTDFNSDALEKGRDPFLWESR